MNSETNKFLVLYQEWPNKRFKVYETSQSVGAKRKIDSFPLTKAGLSHAIEVAERKDAKLIVMDVLHFDSESFFQAITRKIKEKKFTLLFKPIQTVPGGD